MPNGYCGLGGCPVSLPVEALAGATPEPSPGDSPGPPGLAEGSGRHSTCTGRVQRGKRTLRVDALRRIVAALRVPGRRLLQEAEEVAAKG